MPKNRVPHFNLQEDAMPAPTTISIDKLNRLIGTPGAPHIIDVRNNEDYAADRRLLPSSTRQDYATVAQWGLQYKAQSVVVSCHHGGKLSHGVAAWLRHMGADAISLDGGFEGWKAQKCALIPESKIPLRDTQGRTIWVTRARPKVDRIACPWLIRRFIDPFAVFLFVLPAEVEGVAARFDATPFDVDGVFWSHRGDTCTFDTMLDEFGLGSEPLQRLATIIRAADTARPELAPEAAGLLAASLGLSRMYSDDLAQLEAGMVLYDSFYRWCRDATEETHNWPNNRSKP
jgi:rhodanese-related sulfurtransferase